MKTKRTKKLLAFIITTAMAVMMFSTVVNAADNYSTVDGPDDVSFTKYLVVPTETAIPNLEFDFTVSAGEAESGSTTKLPVYAGNDSKRVAFKTGKSFDDITGSATFSSTDSTTAGTSTDGIANSDTKKYAQHDVTLDFSVLTFNEPGIYRYIITEDDVDGATIDTPRTLDIYVEDNNGNLTVTDTVLYKTAPTDSSTGDKTDNFINQYPSSNLYVGKKIAGNQASKDKYFRFTIAITGATPNSKINLGGNYTTTAISGSTNGATVINPDDGTSYTNPSMTDGLTTDENGAVTKVFYLQGDQYVNLMGISEGAHYVVSEDDYSTDGYTTAEASDEDFEIGTLTFDDDVEGDIGSTGIYTGFTNTKDGTIPTGIIISVAGLLIVGIIAVIGFVFFGVRSKRRYEED